MVKQGPCYHCGVTSTPLWRNGPPEKPVLCNACGSRWRTKGTLANYTPLHARTEADDYEDQRLSRANNTSLNKNKEVNFLKRKQNDRNLVSGWIVPDYNQQSLKVIDEDASNRSSSGSAVSNSESCAQFGGTDASDLTGPAQSVVGGGMVPSKKRTCVNRQKPSPVEKLTKDLYTILHEQQLYFSLSSEEDLIFESETPMVSVEIGHGSVLIRHPNSIAREEESEASSLSVDNKQCPISEAYSCSGAVDTHNDFTGMNFLPQGVDNINYSASQGIQREKLKSVGETETSQILGHHDSPLGQIDLINVVNYEVFLTNMTNEERQNLLKCLPAVDTTELPDSLKSMFNSYQFRKNLTYFQQLLGKGVFEPSSPGSNAGDWQTLKQLALCDFSLSKWVEQCGSLKMSKYGDEKSIALGCTGTASSNAANEERLSDNLKQSVPELKSTVRGPKRVMVRAGSGGEEVFEDGSCFSPKGSLAVPSNCSPHMLDSFNFVNESSDQDLLLEVRSNSSFPEAELLHPTFRFGTLPSTSSSYAHY